MQVHSAVGGVPEVSMCLSGCLTAEVNLHLQALQFTQRGGYDLCLSRYSYGICHYDFYTSHLIQ